MAHSPQRIVFVARASIDVDANAREVAGQGLCGDADAIGQGGDLIEVDGVLEWWFSMRPLHARMAGADPLFRDGRGQRAPSRVGCGCSSGETLRGQSS